MSQQIQDIGFWGSKHVHWRSGGKLKGQNYSGGDIQLGTRRYVGALTALPVPPVGKVW